MNGKDIRRGLCMSEIVVHVRERDDVWSARRSRKHEASYFYTNDSTSADNTKFFEGR